MRDFTKYFKLYFEHDFEFLGNSHLLIFAHHVNGGLILLPRDNVAVEASDGFDCYAYNMEKLIEAGLDANLAGAISEYIATWVREHPEEKEQATSQDLISRLVAKHKDGSAAAPEH